MASIKVTYNITFTSTSPFNESTYGERSLEEAVELEQEVDQDSLLEILSDGSYRDLNYKVNVEVVE